MNEKQIEMIKKVYEKYNHLSSKVSEYMTPVRVSNLVFTSKLDFREIGTLVLLSKFNVWTPIDTNLTTSYIDLDTLIASVCAKRTSEISIIVKAINSLNDKGIINIEFFKDDNYNEVSLDRKNVKFKVIQRFYSNEDRMDDETWEALHDVPGYEESIKDRSSSVMYLEEVENILFSDENINTKIKMLAMYGAVCIPIFYYKKDKNEKVPKGDLGGRAVSWNKIEHIGNLSGYQSMDSIRKVLRLLIKHKIIARYDVRFGGNTIYHTKTYFSRYADAYVMSSYIIHQIKDNKILNVLDTF